MRLSLELHPYDGSDPLGMFPLFQMTTVPVLPPRLGVVFRRLLAWVVYLLAGERQMAPQFRMAIFLLCCQLPTDFK